MTRLLLVLCSLTVLAGCATTGDLCSVGPSQPDPGFQDRWTINEKAFAYTYNRSGEDICGWKKPT